VLSGEPVDGDIVFNVAKQTKIVLDFKADIAGSFSLTGLAAKLAGASLINVVQSPARTIYSEISKKL